jgi:hypothetical protein
MSFSKTIKQATVALGLAALSSLYAVSISSAQSFNPAASPTVRVESPNNGARVYGNVTFTGLAVDCPTGQPATRVAVHDGPNSTYQYLADVSMDTNRAYADACAGVGGTNRIGFTLIVDSNRLSEGSHALAFVAHYPSGQTQTTTVDVVVDNIANRPVMQYGPRYSGVYYGGYYVNGLYTPNYTQCVAWNSLGNCIDYRVVSAPVVTPTVYPGCVTNAYGTCISYPYNYNPYTGTYTGTYNPYVYNTNYLNGLYYWNGVAWIRR